MRFNVAAMIAAIDEQLERDRTDWQARVDTAIDESATEKAEWIDEFAETWRAAFRKASAKLRRHEPLVTDDFPKNGQGYMLTFRSSVRSVGAFREDPDLVGLRRILSTVADDEVTTSGLRDLGVTSAALRRVAQAMAPKSIRY